MSPAGRGVFWRSSIQRELCAQRRGADETRRRLFTRDTQSLPVNNRPGNYALNNSSPKLLLIPGEEKRNLSAASPEPGAAGTTEDGGTRRMCGVEAV